MAYVIIPRHDTVAALSALNRIYAEGELILEEQLDGTYKLKVGNGTQTYNLLAYIGGAGGGGSNAFGSIVVSGQSTIVADTISDVLTAAVGAGLTATTNATTDTLTISPLYGTTAGTICQGNDSRIGGAVAPAAHAATHRAGGTDAIKLDSLAAPDDVTTLNATTSAHGLMPKLGTVGQYFCGDGTRAESIPGITIRATGGDDTATFQAAVNSLSATGGIIYLWPELYRLQGTVDVPYTIIFQGSGFQEGPTNSTAGVVGRPQRGTWIWHDSTTLVAFQFASMNTGQNSGMRDIAFWEAHPTVGTGWAPTVRNFCVYVAAAADRVEFRNVHFHNVYKAIYGDNVGRLILNHVTGQPFHTGIQQDRAYDMPRWQNIHFWPYWSGHESVVNWSQANGVAFRVGRLDGLYADHIFAFGYLCIFHLYAPTVDLGSSTKLYIGNVYGDVSARMLTVDQNGATLHFNQVTTQGLIWYGSAGGSVVALPASAGVVINSNDCRVSFGHLRVDEVLGSAVVVNGTGNTVWIDHADFRRWNLGGATRIGAISVASATSYVSLQSEPNIIKDNAGDFLIAAQSGLVIKPMGQNFVSNPANELRASSNAAGALPFVTSIGSDTNIDLGLYPKGTGKVQFGTRVASADAVVTGYIEIKDAGGTLRRLAIIG